MYKSQSCLTHVKTEGAETEINCEFSFIDKKTFGDRVIGDGQVLLPSVFLLECEKGTKAISYTTYCQAIKKPNAQVTTQHNFKYCPQTFTFDLNLLYKTIDKLC